MKVTPLIVAFMVGGSVVAYLLGAHSFALLMLAGAGVLIAVKLVTFGCCGKAGEEEVETADAAAPTAESDPLNAPRL